MPRWLARLLRGTDAAATPFLIQRNAGWCWFHSPRAIVVDGRVLFGSVAGRTRDGAEAGHVRLTAFDPCTRLGESATVWARGGPDDHNVPAVLDLGAGRALAAYQGHGDPGADGRLIRWRSVERIAPLSLGPEQVVDVGAPTTYSNLASLGDGRIVNVHRGLSSNPNLLMSEDAGARFRLAGRLLHWPRPSPDDPRFSGQDGGRPYAVYAIDGQGGLHVLACEDHPRAYDNSIYHGIWRDGVLRRADGAPAAILSGEPAPRPDALDCVFAGQADAIAWPIELRIELSTQRPVALFSVREGDAAVRRRPGEGGKAHRYLRATHDGVAWRLVDLGTAGGRLFAGEEDYTGLASLDPVDSDIVAAARNDGEGDFRLEIGAIDKGGALTSRVLAADAGVSHIRPIIVALDERRSLVMWMRGVYRSYTDFDTDIWGAIYDRRAVRTAITQSRTSPA